MTVIVKWWSEWKGGIERQSGEGGFMQELEKILKEIDRLENHAIFHLKTEAPPHFLERIFDMIISQARKGIEVVEQTRNENKPKWVS